MSTDVISALAGVAPGSALDTLRAERPEAMSHAQASYEAIFDPATVRGVSIVERLAIALRVATLHAASGVADHYRARLAASGADATTIKAAGLDGGRFPRLEFELPARLQAMLRHADMLSTRPVEASPADMQALADAGLSPTEIVTASQVVGFLSFQIRVIAALRLIGGTPGGHLAPSAGVAGAAPTGAAATVIPPVAGIKRPTAFTVEQLEWTPWIQPIDLADADEVQAQALEGTRGNSPYFRLLARDAKVLLERTATDRGIFYTHGGAPRADRELSAAAASRLNGCIYCASVHARLASQLSKRVDDVDRLLDRGVDDIPGLGLGDRWTAVVDFAVALSATPPRATAAHVERLRALGLAELEILDVAQAASFFAWANRLMLSLGEPYYE
jgi:alkylhydroperoxidase domain protein/CMD domain protein